jgi:predicted transposase YbfD/YdcC
LLVKEQFLAVFDAKKEKVITEVKQEAHDRKEERYTFQLKPNFSPEIAEKWPTIRSIIAVERHRIVKGKGGCISTSCYVSSLSPKHKLIECYIRQHWRIESTQHYILVVVFKEDAVDNMALFRRFVMNMLRQHNRGAPSQRNKLKKPG